MAGKYKLQLKWTGFPNGDYQVANKAGEIVAKVIKPSGGMSGWWMLPCTEEFQAKVEMDLPVCDFEEVAGTWGISIKKYFRTKREIEFFIMVGYSVDQVARWKRVRAALA